MMLPLRNDGAGLTVRMKLNLPVGFPYCCGTLLIFFSYSCRSASDKSRSDMRPTSFLHHNAYRSRIVSRTGLRVYMRAALAKAALVDQQDLGMFILIHLLHRCDIRFFGPYPFFIHCISTPH